MNIMRWETPASDLKALSKVSLVDDGHVVIVLEGSREGKRERVKFVFKRVFGYRNLLEEYRTALWRTVEGMPAVGWTRRIIDSPWLRELRENEPLFLLHGGDQALHYLLCTEDDVIEVLTKEEPVIISLG